jgi:hypothetical protein
MVAGQLVIRIVYTFNYYLVFGISWFPLNAPSSPDLLLSLVNNVMYVFLRSHISEFVVWRHDASHDDDDAFGVSKARGGVTGNRYLI